MKKNVLIIFVLTIVLMSSCGVRKYSDSSHRQSREPIIYRDNSEIVGLPPNKIKFSKRKSADKLIETAEYYMGVKYKYGGNSFEGIDCSGLTCRSFESVGVELPRKSSLQSEKGVRVSINNVTKGDLLFFATGRKRSKISHVGIVTRVKNRDVFFIHASSSRGVMVSSLSDKYWDKRFKFAKRIL